MVYLFLADGFEEVEAITPFDYLKRAGFDVKTIGVDDEKITGSHNLEVTVDLKISDLDLKLKEDDLIILPGGLQGTKNLISNDMVLEYVKYGAKNAAVAAICAAPSILGKLGLLEGVSACCYPGFEGELKGANVILNSDVVVDKNIITSKGAGTAQQFSFEIIKYLSDEENCKKIINQVQWKI